MINSKWTCATNAACSAISDGECDFWKRTKILSTNESQCNDAFGFVFEGAIIVNRRRA